MSRRAFTLVELLVVLAIMAIIVSISLPAITGTMRGSHLTQAGFTVENELSLARQAALARNCIAEVRFYKLIEADAGDHAGAEKYRALQTFLIDDTGLATALDHVKWLPGAVMIDSGAALSPLVGNTGDKSWTGNDPQIVLPRVDRAYTARTLQFRSDGSTTLGAGAQSWFLTLHGTADGDNLVALPRNFYLVQVDPQNGKSRTYRP